MNLANLMPNPFLNLEYCARNGLRKLGPLEEAGDYCERATKACEERRHLRRRHARNPSRRLWLSQVTRLLPSWPRRYLRVAQPDSTIQLHRRLDLWENKAPKDSERYFALLKVDQINFADPSESKNKILFENLTPLFPDAFDAPRVMAAPKT